MNSDNHPQVKMIVAGSYEEYRRYCQENGYNPNKDKHIRYVGNQRAFAGFWGYEVILYGQHWLNPVYRQSEHRSALITRSSRVICLY